MSHKVIYDLFLSSTGVTTDSRKVKPGQLFFALKGDRFDGNQYAQEVLDKGACAAIVDDPAYHSGPKTILVDNGLKALQDLATTYRQSFDIPVIAITGSNGKTTTKELLTTVLSQKYKVHATVGNYNNHIGVPLTLLQAPRHTQILVVEMGANHIGEINELCHIAQPTFGLITNVGQAHLEGFGSYNGVILAKTELYRYIQKHGDLVFVNKKDKVLLYNLPNGAKMIPYIEGLKFFNKGLQLGYFNENNKQCVTQLSGTYNQDNILAAKTVGEYFDVPHELIDQSIIDYEPKMNRSQLVDKGSTSFILDAYNANPSSMLKAIDSFAQLETDKPKVLILGDMKELGGESMQLHANIITHLGQYSWDQVILVGQEFGEVVKGIADGGAESLAKKGEGRAYKTYLNIETLSTSKDEVLTMLSNKLCLVKASRSIGLERIIDFYS